jgi:tetratricopeptide (TPR) repeat protein
MSDNLFLQFQQQYISDLINKNIPKKKQSSDKIVNKSTHKNVVSEKTKPDNSDFSYQPTREFNKKKFKRKHRIRIDKKKVKTDFKLLILIISVIILSAIAYYVTTLDFNTSIKKLELAQQFHKKGITNPENYRTAINYYKTYKNEVSSLSELELIKINYFIGLCYFELGEYINAQKIFYEIYNKTDSNYKVLSLFQIADCLYKQDRLLEAIDKFKFIYSSYPEHTIVNQCYAKISEIYYKQKQWNKIIDFTENILNNNIVINSEKLYFYLSESYKNRQKNSSVSDKNKYVFYKNFFKLLNNNTEF